MITSEKNRFGKNLIILRPGEYYATVDDCMLGTVAGLSAVVCLFDKYSGIGGMGHLIVPGSIGTEGIISDKIAKEGIMSMEYLMAEIVKLGGDRKRLKAKIFGAGCINGDARSSIAKDIINGNLLFVQEYFNLENIEVEKQDLGGGFRRKIYFYPRKGVVYRKSLVNNSDASEFINLEKEYIDKVFRNKDRYGEVILF